MLQLTAAIDAAVPQTVLSGGPHQLLRSVRRRLRPAPAEAPASSRSRPAAGRAARRPSGGAAPGCVLAAGGAVTAVLLVVAVRLLGLAGARAAAARDGRSAHARLVRWDSQWYAGIARSGYGHTVLHPDGRHLVRLRVLPALPAAGAGRLRR